MKPEKTLFYVFLLFFIIISFIEAVYDCQVIQDIAGNSQRTEAWKLTGNALMFLWICQVTIFSLYFLKANRILLWIPIFMLTWWLIHDMALALFMTGDPNYIGLGDWDQYFARICQQSGLIFAGFKGIWITLGLLTYLWLVNHEKSI